MGTCEGGGWRRRCPCSIRWGWWSLKLVFPKNDFLTMRGRGCRTVDDDVGRSRNRLSLYYCRGCPVATVSLARIAVASVRFRTYRVVRKNTIASHENGRLASRYRGNRMETGWSFLPGAASASRVSPNVADLLIDKSSSGFAVVLCICTSVGCGPRRVRLRRGHPRPKKMKTISSAINTNVGGSHLLGRYFWWCFNRLTLKPKN